MNNKKINIIYIGLGVLLFSLYQNQAPKSRALNLNQLKQRVAKHRSAYDQVYISPEINPNNKEQVARLAKTILQTRFLTYYIDQIIKIKKIKNCMHLGLEVPQVVNGLYSFNQSNLSEKTHCAYIPKSSGKVSYALTDDKFKPEILILLQPRKVLDKVSDVLFKFKINDEIRNGIVVPSSGLRGGASKILCRLDNKAWLPCSGEASYKNVGPGKHIFSVFAMDFMGNSSMKTSVFRVSPGYVEGQVKGSFDKIQVRKGYVVFHGWACQQGENRSINVKLFAGGPSGKGQYIGSAKANIGNEAAVGDACSSDGKHRFRFAIPNIKLAKHKGKAIHIHGIALSKKNNNYQIARSGLLRLPKIIRYGAVKGRIDAVKNQSNGVRLQGWACQEGINQPIEVHIYLGGRYRTGQYLTRSSANKYSAAYVAEKCNAGGNHRFDIVIPHSKLKNKKNKTIFIHGISIDKAFGNPLISRSGVLRIP